MTAICWISSHIHRRLCVKSTHLVAAKRTANLAVVVRAADANDTIAASTWIDLTVTVNGVKIVNEASTHYMQPLANSYKFWLILKREFMERAQCTTEPLDRLDKCIGRLGGHGGVVRLPKASAGTHLRTQSGWA